MRVKHVYATSEIPHLWANKTQQSARNAQGNLYFEGDTINSYGSHFVIARHVTSGKKSAVLFTERKWSNTTARHCHAVRMALPKRTTVFHVEEVYTGSLDSRTNHDTNLKSYVSRVEQHVISASRARSSWKKESEHGMAFRLRNEAREYAKFFRLPLPKIAPIPALDSAGLAKIKASESKKSAEKAAKEKARKIEAAKQELEALNKWRAGESSYSNFYNSPIALRLSKDKTEVQTSRGAVIPVDHALRVLAIVRRVVERQEPFVTNGKSIFAGPYKVDRIEVNGDMKVGCHFLTYSEIERLAPELEALNIQS